MTREILKTNPIFFVAKKNFFVAKSLPCSRKKQFTKTSEYKIWRIFFYNVVQATFCVNHNLKFSCFLMVR